MIVKTALYTFLVLTIFHAKAQISVKQILCDSRTEPIGVDNQQPPLSWKLTSKKRNVTQTAYQVLVADDSLTLQKNIGNIWDSKKTISDQSIQVIFSGKKLEPAKTYYWKVKVWDNFRRISIWSKPSKWQMGLFSAADWKGARWIGYDKLPDSERLIPAVENPSDIRWNKGTDVLPLMRKKFDLVERIKSNCFHHRPGAI